MFFEQFQKMCKLNNTTPSAVIAELKLGSSNVTRWKNGTAPNSDNVIAIAKYFNVNIDWLLTGEGNPNPSASPSQMPVEQLEKYLVLDAYGKKNVDMVLNNEYERCTDAKTYRIASRDGENEITLTSAQRKALVDFVNRPDKQDSGLDDVI